jgi:hypothetical protein
MGNPATLATKRLGQKTFLRWVLAIIAMRHQFPIRFKTVDIKGFESLKKL